MKWKCPKKPCHPIKWEIGGVFRLLLAQLLQKALLLKYRCPANDLQNGKGAPSLSCLPCLPYLLAICPRLLSFTNCPSERGPFEGGSGKGLSRRGKVRRKCGWKCGQDTRHPTKVSKRTTERGCNFLQTSQCSFCVNL